MLKCHIQFSRRFILGGANMPHSSGGGSHGGGFHSSGHSSGGNGNSGPRYSRRPYPGCHYYVYYFRGRERRYYGDAQAKPMTKFSLILTYFIISIFFLVGVMMIAFEGKVTPKKLKGTEYNTILVEDNVEVLGDIKDLRYALENFKKETGVVPSIYTINNDDWQVNYSSLEDYAYDKYLSLFNDEKHWLFVYSVSKTDSNNWHYEFMQGNDTDKIISSHSFDPINKKFHDDLMHNKPLNEALINVFSDAERYMKSYVQGDMIFAGIVFMLFPVLGIIGVTKSYLSSRGIENSYEISADTKETKCEYCGASFLDGEVSKCPHCGASLRMNKEVVNYNE